LPASSALPHSSTPHARRRRRHTLNFHPWHVQVGHLDMLPAVVSAARGAAARGGEGRNRTARSKGDFGSEGSCGKWRAFLVFLSKSKGNYYVGTNKGVYIL
jgi:hypothetical protein